MIKPCLILDVGCGGGKHSVNLAKKGFKVVAIELSNNGIVAAKKWAEHEKQNVLFVQGDVENMPFKDGAFNASFCGLLLHHFPKLDKLAKELSRITQKYLFAVETNALEPMTYLKFNILNVLFGLPKMSRNQRALSPKKTERLFKRLGFGKVKFHWLDVHVRYKGVVGLVTNIYIVIFSFFPKKFRSNKFVLSCEKHGSVDK